MCSLISLSVPGYSPEPVPVSSCCTSYFSSWLFLPVPHVIPDLYFALLSFVLCVKLLCCYFLFLEFALVCFWIIYYGVQLVIESLFFLFLFLHLGLRHFATPDSTIKATYFICSLYIHIIYQGKRFGHSCNRGSMGFILWGPWVSTFHGNLSNSCWDISIWTKMSDHLTDRHHHPTNYPS